MNCPALHLSVALIFAMGFCSYSSAQAKPAVDALIRQGKLPEAEHQLQRSLKQNPRDARWLNLLGIVRLKQGKFVDAEKQFA
jgi:Flp pilus assembly protein TadD